MTTLKRLHLGFVRWEAFQKISKPNIPSWELLEKSLSHQGINLRTQALFFFGGTDERVGKSLQSFQICRLKIIDARSDIVRVGDHDSLTNKGFIVTKNHLHVLSTS